MIIIKQLIKKLLGEKNIIKLRHAKLKLVFKKNQLLNKDFNDFFFFPFNSCKPLPETGLSTMKKAADIFKSLNISFSLFDGTLLGVYRDNRLIPHDTDIDFSVFYPADASLIEQEFTKNGFTLGRKVMAFGKVQVLVFYTDNEELFEVLFLTVIGDNAYSFCENDFYFRYALEHCNNLIPYVFNEYTFYIPQNTEKWLEHVYGENWRTPKSSKPNDWREGGVEYLAAVPFEGSFKKLLLEINKKENVTN
jgi:hypothetical protein